MINNYYDKKFKDLINELNYRKSEALIEIAHIYLDNKPTKYPQTKRDEEFWNSRTLIDNENIIFELDTYALLLMKNFKSKKLYQIELIKNSNISAIKEAIKTSKIFLDENNDNYKILKETLEKIQYEDFFKTCDFIAKHYKKLQQNVKNQEKELMKFFYVDLLFLMSLSSLEYAKYNIESPNYLSIYNVIMTKILEHRTNNKDRKKRKIDKQYIQTKEQKYFIEPISFICRNQEPPLPEYKIFQEIFKTYEKLVVFEENQLATFLYDENFETLLEADKIIFQPINIEKHIKTESTPQKSQLILTFFEDLAKSFTTENEFKKVYLEKGNNPKNINMNYIHEINASRTILIMKMIYGLEEDVFIDNNNKLNLTYLAHTGATFTTLYRFEFLEKYFHVLTRHDMNNFWLSHAEISYHSMTTHMKNRFPLIYRTIEEEVKQFNHDFQIESSDKLVNFWSLDIKDINTKYPNLYEKPFIKIDDYIFIFPWMIAFNASPMTFINSLLRVHTNRMELIENGKKNNVRKEEVSRSEKNLVDLFSKLGFKVQDGYYHSKSEEYGVQDIDIVASKDGHLFILELKSTYVRDGLKSNWEYKTSAIRKAGNQLLKRKRYIEKLLKNKDQEFIGKFGEVKQIHSWIVDTAFKFDHEYFSNSLKISMFELIHALGDYTEGFYPHGFNVETFIKNIESEKLFEKIEHINITKEEATYIVNLNDENAIWG